MVVAVVTVVTVCVHSNPLVGRDLRDLTEAPTTELQEEDVSTSSEPVLLRLEDSTTQEVLVLLLDAEMHVSVDHVLQLI